MLPKVVKKFQYASEAANNFQDNLLIELKKNHEVQVLSYLGFPKEDQWTADIEREMLQEGIQYISRQGLFSRFTGLIFYYLKFLRMAYQTDYILLYNYYYINFLILPLARLLRKKTALILADHSGKGDYSSWIRKRIAVKTEQDYYKFDKLIILSKHLYQKMSHPNKLHFPGALRLSAYRDFSLKTTKETRVLYAGLLNRVTGIDLYLSAIRQVTDRNVQFLFTGRGPLKTTIEAAAKRDNRILYLGFLSREAYYQLLDDVDIVINPRNMHLPENQNNFPSKIMEYLASGRRILSTRFPGYEDFEPYITFCGSDSREIAEGLLHILGQSEECDKVFQANRRFAAQFDWSVQVKRITDFLGSE